jgi:hypothetical protein
MRRAVLKKINPLNVHYARRTDFCPPYFETVNIEPSYNIAKALDEWIFYNTSGRYYIGSSVDCESGTIKTKIKIGFEKSSEMSYFMLACPHLKYNK